MSNEEFDAWGGMLHEHWENKKRMSSKISISWVDYLAGLDQFNKVLRPKLVAAGLRAS